jgi:hypothetical protein
MIATETSPQRSSWRNAFHSIARTLPEHIPVYVCAFLFCATTVAVTSAYHIKLEANSGFFFLKIVSEFTALAVAVFALIEFIALIRRGEKGSPTVFIAKRLAARLGEGDRAGNIFHFVVAFVPLMISFTAMKDQIPQLHPFSWDTTFSAWDRAIGFGHQPWALLQPYFGFPPVTAAINFVYDAWFLVMFTVLLWQAFSARRDELRLQFLLAFSFGWFIGGNLLAAMFSSAGPCFYGMLHIPGANPYAAQMVYLHAANQHWPVWSIGVQDLLWKSYVRGDGHLGGISAMPSMHLISTMTMALWAARVDKRLGWAFAIFTALIFIGSIHLGWHYAVDSIAGILLAVVFWAAAGLIARMTMRLAKSPISSPRPFGVAHA